MAYYIAIGSEQRGPFPKEQLLSQGLRPESMVWTDGMAQWQRADSIPELAALVRGPAATQPRPHTTRAYPYAASSLANSLPQISTAPRSPRGSAESSLAIFGIHKFILGLNSAGVTMLLISLLTCGIGAVVMAVFGIIEGIIYLSKSDAEFYQTYMVQKKAWF